MDKWMDRGWINVIPVEELKNTVLCVSVSPSYSLLSDGFPSSDDGSTDGRDRESSGRPGGPADGALGDAACAERLPVSGQISDQIQTGGEQRLEGTEAPSILQHPSSSSLAVVPVSRKLSVRVS